MNLNEQLRSWSDEYGVTFSRRELDDMVILGCEKQRTEELSSRAMRWLPAFELKEMIAPDEIVADLYRELLFSVSVPARRGK